MKILICLKSKSKCLAVENTIAIDKSIPQLLSMRKNTDIFSLSKRVVTVCLRHLHILS